MLPAVGCCGGPSPAFVGTTPPFCPNPAVPRQPQPDQQQPGSIERLLRLGGPTPTTTASSARARVLRSVSPSSMTLPQPQPGEDDEVHPEDTPKDDDGADRMFATARALHLRRHRWPASRGLALELFRETLRRRPAWKETDSRFAVEAAGVDQVFRYFSSSPRGNDTSTDDGGDVSCIRETLTRIGYAARSVQERFGVAGGQRLPGPYYLRKSFDHRNVSCSRAWACFFLSAPRTKKQKCL